MLRIEKSRGKLTYQFLQKQRRFGRDFCKALLLTLLLHLLALTLFGINSCPDDNLPLLKPIKVEVVQNPSPTIVTTIPIEIRGKPGDLSYLQKMPPQNDFLKMHDPKPDFSSIETLDYETLNIDFDND